MPPACMEEVCLAQAVLAITVALVFPVLGVVQLLKIRAHKKRKQARKAASKVGRPETGTVSKRVVPVPGAIGQRVASNSQGYAPGHARAQVGPPALGTGDAIPLLVYRSLPFSVLYIGWALMSIFPDEGVWWQIGHVMVLTCVSWLVFVLAMILHYYNEAVYYGQLGNRTRNRFLWASIPFLLTSVWLLCILRGITGSRRWAGLAYILLGGLAVAGVLVFWACTLQMARTISRLHGDSQCSTAMKEALCRVQRRWRLFLLGITAAALPAAGFLGVLGIYTMGSPGYSIAGKHGLMVALELGNFLTILLGTWFTWHGRQKLHMLVAESVGGQTTTVTQNSLGVGGEALSRTGLAAQLTYQAVASAASLYDREGEDDDDEDGSASEANQYEYGHGYGHGRGNGQGQGQGQRQNGSTHKNDPRSAGSPQYLTNHPHPMHYHQHEDELSSTDVI